MKVELGKAEELCGIEKHTGWSRRHELSEIDSIYSEVKDPEYIQTRSENLEGLTVQACCELHCLTAPLGTRHLRKRFAVSGLPWFKSLIFC